MKFLEEQPGAAILTFTKGMKNLCKSWKPNRLTRN